ncbi:DUF3489 domain-containing protein [Qipengyuania aurantiaca]|uniref:DUF3489 domain-containing protein n=1 Tax=Qipengyuania aurantiaca TaxID=2867233 RepID=A0ABX8ZPV5_9SPHN|nr:DUF3489 domain-containing protein [Qipengyuania aurantiaca]QZD90972.1 DUF3489 domain-containing protein [Qipengyuania aurantiaca]
MTTTANKKTAAKRPMATKATKASAVKELLEREDGADLEAICKATGWQSHSCRAFMTGLRKKGREVVRYKNDKGTSIYKLTPVEAEEKQG